MSLLRSLSDGLRSLFFEGAVGQELDENCVVSWIRAAEEKMKQGMSRKERFGAVRLEEEAPEVTKEVVRSVGWESFVETLWQDLRFGARHAAQESRLYRRGCDHTCPRHRHEHRRYSVLSMPYS